MTNDNLIADNLKKEIEKYFTQQPYNGWNLNQSIVITTPDRVIYKYYFEGKPTDKLCYRYPFISINTLNSVRIGFNTICNDPTFLNERLRNELISKILGCENNLSIPVVDCNFGYGEEINKLDIIYFDVDLEGIKQPYMEKIINFIELAYSVYYQNYENIRDFQSVENKLDELEEIFKSKIKSIRREIDSLNEFLKRNSSIKNGEK